MSEKEQFSEHTSKFLLLFKGLLGKPTVEELIARNNTPLSALSLAANRPREIFFRLEANKLKKAATESGDNISKIIDIFIAELLTTSQWDIVNKLLCKLFIELQVNEDGKRKLIVDKLEEAKQKLSNLHNIAENSDSTLLNIRITNIKYLISTLEKLESSVS